MRSKCSIIGAVLLFCVTVGEARATTLSFDDIPLASIPSFFGEGVNVAYVQDGYGGLTWNNSVLVLNPADPGSGDSGLNNFIYTIYGGAYWGGSQVAVPTTGDGDDTVNITANRNFTFTGAQFAAIALGGGTNTLLVEGYSGGNKLCDHEINIQAVPAWFDDFGDCTGIEIDQLRITGTSAPLFIMDNLTVTREESSRVWYQTGGTAGLQITNLIVDPSNSSVLYAGTFGSGVYKSSDGGASWLPINTGLQLGLDTYILSMDSLDTDTLYVGTVGDGILKSINGGTSWNPINNGLTNLRVHMAPAVDPTDSSILYVGTEGPKFFKSTNGGAGWTESTLPSAGDEVCEVAVDPSNSSTIYAGMHFDEGYHDGGVYKSIDAGQSWIPINNGLPDITSSESSVAFLTFDPTDSQTLYVTTEGGGVFKSLDGGQNWSSSNSGITTGITYGLAINPVNPEIIYVGTGGDGVFLSPNGGTNWYPVTTTGLTDLIAGIALDPSNPSILYAGTFGDGVFKSIAGDYAGDADVDGIDLAKFLGYYSNQSNPGADINDDGTINLEDAAGFAKNFGLNP